MKRKLLDLLLKISDQILSIHRKFTDEESVKLDYSSLSPISYGDEKGHYSNALKWALDNRNKKDIKNIALTGPYGSGKSTILKTFQKNYSGDDLHFLNISLATFKEEKIKRDEKGNIVQKEKEDRLRLIETSILQQIFYHEEDKDIPDSRFKKIKSYSNRSLLLISLGTMLFLLSIISFTYPDLIPDKFQNFSTPAIVIDILHYGSIVVIIAGIMFLVFKSVRIISSITINKLKFQNAEIEIADTPNKSILNHHLDEILYFFSVTSYNVVIIEDLDRFQETEIFTKLREINLLLNNSKKTQEKGIVFIYAVRDDMFSNNERIKFFDFIIPVIPVINSSNSSEILIRKKKKYGYSLSESFIENLAYFIDDMRLLHNVTNEFYLYKQKHGETPLNEEKLFALITYKNIYPNDFVKLSKNDGELYRIINSKTVYIKNEIDKINEEISDLKNEIKNIEQIGVKSIKELRLLYIGIILSELQNFQSFVINNARLSVDELLNDENFDYARNNELKFAKQGQDNYGRLKVVTQSLPLEFINIEKKVDPVKSYLEREEEIKNFNSGKTVQLRTKIKILEKEKIRKRNQKISDLINSNLDVNPEISSELNNEFITILIRNGYIAEDYLDYISLFHGESITRSDHKFLISIKNKHSLMLDYRLAKIEKIIPKIDIIDFGTEYILNYDLIEHILKHPKNYSNHVDFIFTKLKDETSRSIEFINGFLEKTDNLNLFVKYLAEYWNGIWDYYVNDITYRDEEIETILKYIVEYADISAIKKIAANSNLKNYILNYPNFLLLTDQTKKLILVIEELELNFTNLNIDESPKELLDFIYKEGYYEINISTIPSLIKKYGEFNQITFDTSNYRSVQESKADELIKKIKSNINDYIQNVYLKLDSNLNEHEDYLVEMLNNKDINKSHKEELVAQISTRISDLKSIVNEDIQKLLIVNNKIEPTWQNLLTAFNLEEKLSDALIDYINDLENARLLADIKIPNEGDEKGKYNTFTRKLLETNEILNEAYDLISNAVPWWYIDLDIERLDKEKVIHLLDHRLIQPKSLSFELLKLHHAPLHIALLEKFKSKFFKIVDELQFDGKDLEHLLNSEVLNHLEKNTLLEKCSNETVTSNLVNLELISSFLLRYDNFEVDTSLLKIIILSNNVLITERIELFSNRLNDVDEEFIKKFLISLGKEYERITYKNRRAKIQNNSHNKILLQNLKKHNYISSYSNTALGLRVNHKRK